VVALGKGVAAVAASTKTMNMLTGLLRIPQSGNER
jgi:hypothetical protein